MKKGKNFFILRRPIIIKYYLCLGLLAAGLFCGAGPVFSTEAILPAFLLKNAPPEAVREIQPRLISHIKTKKPVAALTFDDGPKPEYSPDILDILDFYKVKATFFVIGRLAQEHPELIERMASDGHEIANHTFDHLRLANLDSQIITDEFAKTNRVIAGIVGRPPKYFRAPGGRFTPRVLKLAAAEKLMGIGWSLNAGDYTAENGAGPSLSSAELVKKIVSHCRPGDIILMHNGGTITREALPLIIKELKEKNFRFVTVDELIKMSSEKNENAG